MKLLLKRIARKSAYTIGRLYIDGVYFCDTLEDYDRLHFGGIKVAKCTAIPAGTYEVTQSVLSPKYSQRKVYMDVCKGYVPRLVDVPYFKGILIHIGNTAADTDGCILVGRNTVVGKVLQSTETWKRLMYDHLLPAKRRGEAVWITVQ